MAKFCTRCGRPLAEGEVCTCAPAPVASGSSVSKFFEMMKNKMGIGDPELNKGDAFENGKLIVPECVKMSEGEVPVKQYTVAKLRNTILGIPYARAVGKLQVTNKRVLFRAAGTSIAGRTTLQQEFAIDEIGGVEARREYVFNFFNFLYGLIVMGVGGAVLSGLIGLMCESALYDGKVAGVVILTLLLGIAGCIPFFMLNKKWALKLLCLGGASTAMIVYGSATTGMAYMLRYMKGDGAAGAANFFGTLLIILGVIAGILALITLMIHSIVPNLILIIKNKSGNEAIDVKKRRLFGAGNEKEDHTGYMEIIPEVDAERSVREAGALISDIQKFGDFGIEKWKQN